jgi:hypothetical protein
MLDSKDREIEAGWLAHDPRRAEIPADVWRQLRAFRRSLLPTAGIIEGVLKKEQLAQSIIEPAVRRRGIARQRKLVELRRMLPGANIAISHKEILEISWLSPKQAILADPQHHGESQDCLLTCYLVAFPPSPHSVTCHSGWALEAPDHACARFIQRAPKADLREALFAAGLSFLAADAETVVPLVGQDSSIYLAAGPGCFACTTIGARTVDGRSSYVYARAQTWLSDAMLKADQTLLPRAATPERTVAVGLWLPESHSPLATPASKFSNPEGRTAPMGRGVPSRPVGVNSGLERL